MIEAKMKAGTYRGEAKAFSILVFSSFLNKIYKENRIVSISATMEVRKMVFYYRIKLILKKAEFIGIYADVNETEFEAFLDSVEWEVGE